MTTTTQTAHHVSLAEAARIMNRHINLIRAMVKIHPQGSKIESIPCGRSRCIPMTAIRDWQRAIGAEVTT